MPFTYIPLWNTLNKHNLGKHDLCQKLGISSSTMAKMTNSQQVSMDVIARICDYFDCGLEDVVEYNSELDLFAQRLRKNVVDCTYFTYTDSFPEYQFVLSDDNMRQLCSLSNVDIQTKISECEQFAITKHKSRVQLSGTTSYAIQSSGNLLVIKGSLTVVELLMEWLLEQIRE